MQSARWDGQYVWDHTTRYGDGWAGLSSSRRVRGRPACSHTVPVPAPSRRRYSTPTRLRRAVPHRVTSRVSCLASTRRTLMSVTGRWPSAPLYHRLNVSHKLAIVAEQITSMTRAEGHVMRMPARQAHHARRASWHAEVIVQYSEQHSASIH